MPRTVASPPVPVLSRSFRKIGRTGCADPKPRMATLEASLAKNEAYPAGSDRSIDALRRQGAGVRGVRHRDPRPRSAAPRRTSHGSRRHEPCGNDPESVRPRLYEPSVRRPETYVVAIRAFPGRSEGYIGEIRGLGSAIRDSGPRSVEASIGRRGDLEERQWRLRSDEGRPPRASMEASIGRRETSKSDTGSFDRTKGGPQDVDGSFDPTKRRLTGP